MDRTLSLITPTGRLTLGNHLGALRRFVAAQDESSPDECFFGLSDLHALTTPQDPAELRATVAEMATLFLAAGLDPSRATMFRQSQVPAHRELAYLLECTAYTGELNRMIQFKEKGRGVPSTRVSLYTYPALMAADILLYRPSVVPVGDDQRQHVELTRDLAIRFNHSYGPVSESVTARATLRRITSGVSVSRMTPASLSIDFDIFRAGSCRSITRAPTGGVRTSGTTKTGP